MQSNPFNYANHVPAPNIGSPDDDLGVIPYTYAADRNPNPDLPGGVISPGAITTSADNPTVEAAIKDRYRLAVLERTKPLVTSRNGVVMSPQPPVQWKKDKEGKIPSAPDRVPERAPDYKGRLPIERATVALGGLVRAVRQRIKDRGTAPPPPRPTRMPLTPVEAEDLFRQIRLDHAAPAPQAQQPRGPQGQGVDPELLKLRRDEAEEKTRAATAQADKAETELLIAEAQLDQLRNNQEATPQEPILTSAELQRDYPECFTPSVLADIDNLYINKEIKKHRDSQTRQIETFPEGDERIAEMMARIAEEGVIRLEETTKYLERHVFRGKPVPAGLADAVEAANTARRAELRKANAAAAAAIPDTKVVPDNAPEDFKHNTSVNLQGTAENATATSPDAGLTPKQIRDRHPQAFAEDTLLDVKRFISESFPSALRKGSPMPSGQEAIDIQKIMEDVYSWSGFRPTTELLQEAWREVFGTYTPEEQPRATTEEAVEPAQPRAGVDQAAQPIEERGTTAEEDPAVDSGENVDESRPREEIDYTKGEFLDGLESRLRAELARRQLQGVSNDVLNNPRVVQSTIAALLDFQAPPDVVDELTARMLERLQPPAET